MACGTGAYLKIRWSFKILLLVAIVSTPVGSSDAEEAMPEHIYEKLCYQFMLKASAVFEDPRYVSKEAGSAVRDCLSTLRSDWIGDIQDSDDFVSHIHCHNFQEIVRRDSRLRLLFRSVNASNNNDLKRYFSYVLVPMSEVELGTQFSCPLFDVKNLTDDAINVVDDSLEIGSTLSIGMSYFGNIKGSEDPVYISFETVVATVSCVAAFILWAVATSGYKSNNKPKSDSVTRTTVNSTMIASTCKESRILGTDEQGSLRRRRQL